MNPILLSTMPSLNVYTPGIREILLHHLFRALYTHVMEHWFMAGFCDGAVGVFDAETLSLHCRIAPSAYISSSSSVPSFPAVVAAHPLDPYQFALGMSGGAVHVIEPSDTETKWGSSKENGIRK